MSKIRTANESEVVTKVLDVLQEYYGNRKASEFFSSAPGELFAVVESILQSGLELGAYGDDIIDIVMGKMIKRLDELKQENYSYNAEKVEQFISEYTESVPDKSDTSKKILN